MQVVDELRHVRHVDLLRVAVERVKRQCGDQCVAQRAHLLEEMTLVDLGSLGMPASPFVDHEFDAVLGVDFAESRPLVLDQRLHLIGLVKLFVPLVLIELEGVPGRSTIIVRGPSLDRRPLAVGPLGEEPPRPVDDRCHWDRRRSGKAARRTSAAIR